MYKRQPLQDTIESGVVIGDVPMEQLLDSVEAHVANGCKRIKLKVNPTDGYDRAALVRKHYPDLVLVADANQSYSYDDIDKEMCIRDRVVVNLYPFRETIAKPNVSLEEAIENIDIGGPTMVRSAAKNHAYVGIVVNPNHYDEILTMLKEHGGLTKEYRFGLAKEAFAHTAAYDVAIANYMSGILNEGPTPPEYLSAYEKVTDLRYGENPHQKAAFYKEIGKAHGMGALKQLHGKELSYNNIVDMEAAWNMVWEFTDPAACIIKHTNPCGAATATTLHDAYVNAYEADSVSAFGGKMCIRDRCIS